MAPRFRNLIFDLDGTLTDSRPGIVQCIHAALQSVGAEAPVNDDLSWCIGPPMRDILARLLATEDRQRIEQAYSAYLENFPKYGIAGNRPYDGIPEILRRLRTAGIDCFVATSKITANAEHVLNTFELRQYFEMVVGSDAAGTLTDKAEMIQSILERAKIHRAACAIIGDREHDILAGKANSIFTIGASWGYAADGELRSAGAALIIDSPATLGGFLLS